MGVIRFQVCRAFVKWKGQFYKKGELLPPEFTERDKHRNTFTSRICCVELPTGSSAVASSPSSIPPDVSIEQEPDEVSFDPPVTAAMPIAAAEVTAKKQQNVPKQQRNQRSAAK